MGRVDRAAGPRWALGGIALTSIRFKFRFVDGEGNESGFLAKRGSFDGTTLDLGGTEIPILAVVRAERRLNRLILWLLRENDSVAPLAVAVRSGLKPLLSEIVATSSARWAELRQERLRAEGRAHEFRAEVCPTCGGTIDLSGRPASPQLYCQYCDALVTIDGDGPLDEARYHHCDECGFFAQPKAFTIFYFYFLLVIYGCRYRRTYMCNTCMRGEGWKMLGGNLIFILGVPTAVTQLVRAYFGGSNLSRAFSGLDKANALAKRNRPEQAAPIYNAIASRIGHGAGIHFNEGLAHARNGRLEEAVGPLQDAIGECSNYPHAYSALCGCYDRLGMNEDLQQLREDWGDAPEEDTSESEAPAERTAS